MSANSKENIDMSLVLRIIKEDNLMRSKIHRDLLLLKESDFNEEPKDILLEALNPFSFGDNKCIISVDGVFSSPDVDYKINGSKVEWLNPGFSTDCLT